MIMQYNGWGDLRPFLWDLIWGELSAKVTAYL